MEINPYDIEIIRIEPEHEAIISQIEAELAELKRENSEEFIGFDRKSKLFKYQGKIAGFCNIHYIRGIPNIEVGILKEFQGRGLGPAITNKLKNSCFENGCDQVQVLVNKKNTRALKAAQKSGFVLIDEGEEFNSYNKEDTYYTLVARNYRKNVSDVRRYR